MYNEGQDCTMMQVETAKHWRAERHPAVTHATLADLTQGESFFFSTAKTDFVFT